MNEPLLLCFADEADRAADIARAAAMRVEVIDRHRFPDGELRLRLPPVPSARAALLRSLDHPNEKLVELLLAARGVRELGVRHLTLVAPYLAYMRQDAAFVPGETVSQRIVGRFIAELFDALITVDPHLHRIDRLDQAVPVSQACVLSGAPVLAELIVSRRERPLLVGPDAESRQWVASAAARHGLEHAVCSKIRHGDRSVEIALPDIPFAGRHAVLLDDVASTGHTVATAARLLRKAGAASVDLAVTHALFAGDALDLIRAAGIDEIWSTDCIVHPTNAASMGPRLGEALKSLVRLPA